MDRGTPLTASQLGSEPALDVLLRLAAAELRGRRSGANEESLQRAVLDEDGRFRTPTLDDEHAVLVSILEARVHVEHGGGSDPISQQVDQMKVHLVLVREAVGGDPDGLAVLEQRVAHRVPAVLRLGTPAPRTPFSGRSNGARLARAFYTNVIGTEASADSRGVGSEGGGVYANDIRFRLMDPLDRVRACTGFEWDAGNSDKSWRKHGVSRAEAEQLFFNQPLVAAADERHSQREERFYVLGRTDAGRLLFAAFTIRGERIRVISARDMSQAERRFFETP
jgi:uncharacterized protein